MNWQQLFFMWCGIAAILFCAFFCIIIEEPPFNFSDYGYFATWVLLIALVTGGLIITFKTKKSLILFIILALVFIGIAMVAFLNYLPYHAYTTGAESI